MELTSKFPGSIKIKGKKATLFINPKNVKEELIDAVIFTGKESKDSQQIQARVTVRGPGEYEVNGATIWAVASEESLICRIGIDGLSVLYLAHIPKSAQEIEQFSPVDILLLGQYSEAIHDLEPKVIIPFEEKIIEPMGKTATKEKKLIIIKEKLPEELQVVVIYG